jgi:segregation and condensation protein B
MSNQPLPEHPDEQLLARLEALLFVAPGSVTAAQLAVALERPIRQIEKNLEFLESRLQNASPTRGLRLQRHQNRFQLTTAPELATEVENFLGLEVTGRLSRAALETLAIIAYQQPVTRPEIDAIRGVNSDGVLKSLLSKGMIQEIGRADRPGRPILYSSTSEFLQNFGLNSLTELPPLAGETNPPENDLVLDQPAPE